MTTTTRSRGSGRGGAEDTKGTKDTKATKPSAGTRPAPASTSRPSSRSQTDTPPRETRPRESKPGGGRPREAIRTPGAKTARSQNAQTARVRSAQGTPPRAPFVLLVTVWFHWITMGQGYQGAEKSIIWAAVFFFFVIRGGNRHSVDARIGWAF